MRLRTIQLLLAFAVFAGLAGSASADSAGVKITEKPPALAASSTATFKFENTPQAATLTCTLSGTRDVSAACSSTDAQTYADLADGPYHFVVSQDASGSADVWDWTVQTAPPNLTAVPPSASSSTSASFSFEEQTGFTYQCAIDGVALPDPCTSPQPVQTLADGSHTFQVAAVDAAGAAGQPATYTWIVDTVPPQTTITAEPPSQAHGPATFAFVSNEAGVSFSCSLDGAATSPCASPVTYEGLADGPHTFAVYATDAAGNVGSPTPPYPWNVDSIAPALSLSEVPPALVASGTATFGFSSSEAVAGFLCSLDDAPFESCDSPVTYESLADGAHTFKVETSDTAGNGSDPVAYAWTVDTTPPGRVRRLRADVGYRRIRLSWRLPGSSDLDHLTLFERAPRSTKAVAAYTGVGTSFRKTNLDNSRTYRYTVVTYDSVGNASGAASVAIPPTALMLSPQPGAVVKAASPSFEWSPAPGASFYNVQLYHNGKKVLSTWPRSSRLRLAPRWSYGGRIHRLGRGWYDWYVWPAFRRGRTARYGALLGRSSFRAR